MTESGNGMVRMWSVFVPSLLHYPHMYPLVAVLYILLVLVDTKNMEQQPRKLLEPVSTHVRFLVSIPSARQALLGRSIYSAPHVRFGLFWWKDRHLNGGTRVDPVPMSSRTYGRPHTFQQQALPSKTF